MKLRLAALTLAVNLLLTSMAFAQRVAPADLKMIDACLKTTEETGGFGGACVGLVADPCIKAAEGLNNEVFYWKACATRELAVWTQKTDKALKMVHDGGFADVTKAAKDSQISFAASPDRFCSVFECAVRASTI